MSPVEQIFPCLAAAPRRDMMAAEAVMADTVLQTCHNDHLHQQQHQRRWNVDTGYSHSSTITLQREGERFRDFNLCNVSETWGVQTWQIVKLKPEVEDWS